MTVWDAIWESDSYSIPKLREDKAKYKLDSIEEHIIPNSHSICVDLGCGGGYFSKELYHRYKCKVFSIDESKTAIKFARNNNSFINANYIVSSATKINLPDSSVDIVFCIGVLEHVRKFDLALSEIKRILKPKGKIVITSSNKYSIMYFDRIIKQILHRWKYGYQKNWSSSRIQRKLKQYDFFVTNYSIEQGYGDFDTINKLDKTINRIIPCWGRYIQIIGEKQ
jgi:ubiquinone/menaquinone biosynthesis C-methylase UbiE